MRKFAFLFLTVILGLTVPASGETQLGDSNQRAMPWTSLLLLSEEFSADYWVDFSRGSNGNPGTKYRPFKTISYALSVADENKTIRVNPGRYDEALGETFPLVLQEGQILIGDETNKGDGTNPTLLVGRGETGVEYMPGMNYTATIVGAEGSKISGFKVGEDSYNFLHFAVFVDGVTMQITKNTFKTSTYGGVLLLGEGNSVLNKNAFETSSYGVYLGFSVNGSPEIVRNDFYSMSIPIDVRGPETYAIISENTIIGSGQVGIQTHQGHPLIASNIFDRQGGYQYAALLCQGEGEPVVRRNVFVCNKGVLIWQNANPDLGSSTESGNNDFSSVTGASLTHEGSATITAIGNAWPNSPPGCGIDIVVSGSGSVAWGTPNLQCP